MNIHRSSSSLWSNCRPDIQRRINALLNYQAEYFRLRVEFHRQLQGLQFAYSPQFEEILERRRKIIDGSVEPTEKEKQINWSMQSDCFPSVPTNSGSDISKGNCISRDEFDRFSFSTIFFVLSM